MATSWNNRESVGTNRITEDGEQRVTESLIERIIETISYVVRTAVSTTWDMRDAIGRMWSEMDETWEVEPGTWSEQLITPWSNRVKP